MDSSTSEPQGKSKRDGYTIQSNSALPGWVSHTLERILFPRLSHRNESSEHHLRPPSPGPGTRMRSPRAFGFEGQWGLVTRAPQNWETETSLLKGTCKISHSQGPKAKQSFDRSLRQTHPLVLERLLGRDGGWEEETLALPGDMDTGDKHQEAVICELSERLTPWHQDLVPPNSL